jgi:serine/threonine protein kinase
MAPEIILKKPYNGMCIDIFAAAVILFIMIAEHPPFSKATTGDSYYKLFFINRLDVFWTAHKRQKPKNFYSNEFIDLITTLLSVDPTHRLSIAEIKSHPWYQGTVPTKLEVEEEFLKRSKKLGKTFEATNEEAKPSLNEEKIEISVYSKPKVYRNIAENEGDDHSEIQH